MSQHHLHTGKSGETLACGYLEQQGFTVLFRNWRHSHYEIDIIASKNDILHFIEVKTRRSLLFGQPEESVSKKKFRNMLQGAKAFLFQHRGWKRVQYDVLSITMLKDQLPEFLLLEDVYL
jgi:putative endonuclease